MTDDTPIGALHKRISNLPARQRLDAWERIKHLAVSGVTCTEQMLAEIVDNAESDPRLSADQEAALRRSYTRHPDETDTQVVYYLLFADRVKVGTTGDLATRLQNIPHDEVLVTEPGGYALERQRHQEFAHLRVFGEWFRHEGSLVEHIKALSSH